MKMIFFVNGSNVFIGKQMCTHLRATNYEVLTEMKDLVPKLRQTISYGR
jgi:hypothetical protein